MNRCALALLLAVGCGQASGQVDGTRVRICDKATSTNCAAVNSSGQVSISGTISASTTGKATAAAPTYLEGTDNPLSIDLSGNIRTLATAQTAAKATAADPAYAEGSTSPLSQDLSGHLRVILGAGSVVDTTGSSVSVSGDALGNPLALDATLTGGAQVCQVRSGAKGASPAALITSTASGANHQGADVLLYDAAGNVIDPRVIRALTATDVVTTAPPANASTNVAQFGGTNVSTGIGAGGVGIPRVTVSNDSSVNQAGTWTVQPGNTANTTPWLASISQGGNAAVVDATFKSLRTTPRPPEVLGCYAVAGNVAYAATTVNGIILSFRWGNASNRALILKVQVQVVATAFTAASIVERQLIVVRAFSVSDTGGTSILPAANMNELATAFTTTLVTDLRIGGFLTAGTGTSDTNPIASAMGWMPGVGNVIGGAQPATLFDATAGYQHPLVLAQNEGFRIRLGAAEGASTRQTFVNLVWCEVAGTTGGF